MFSITFAKYSASEGFVKDGKFGTAGEYTVTATVGELKGEVKVTVGADYVKSFTAAKKTDTTIYVGNKYSAAEDGNITISDVVYASSFTYTEAPVITYTFAPSTAEKEGENTVTAIATMNGISTEEEFTVTVTSSQGA